MERIIKIGDVKVKKSIEIKNSKIGLGFKKLDRDAFDPTQCYDKIGNLGVKWARIQSGWIRPKLLKAYMTLNGLTTLLMA